MQFQLALQQRLLPDQRLLLLGLLFVFLVRVLGIQRLFHLLAQFQQCGCIRLLLKADKACALVRGCLRLQLVNFHVAGCLTQHSVRDFAKLFHVFFEFGLRDVPRHIAHEQCRTVLRVG